MVRLMTQYDAGLPNVTDGNTGDSFSHGQYASGFGLANDIQVIDLDNYISSGGTSFAADGQNFTLTLGTATTATITYSSNPTTMAANIATALEALPGVGTGNVTVGSTVPTSQNNYPQGPATAYQGYSVIFTGRSRTPKSRP